MSKVDLPPDHPERVAENLETERMKLIKQFRLREDTTFEQIGAWRKAVDEFENEEESLHMHFIDRLRMATGMNLSDNTSWAKIHELFGRLLLTIAKEESDNPDERNLLKMLGAVHPDDLQGIYDRICGVMGFPAGTYSDLTGCIEKGMEFEKQYRITGKIDG